MSCIQALVSPMYQKAHLRGDDKLYACIKQTCQSAAVLVKSLVYPYPGTRMKTGMTFALLPTSCVEPEPKCFALASSCKVQTEDLHPRLVVQAALINRSRQVSCRMTQEGPHSPTGIRRSWPAIEVGDMHSHTCGAANSKEQVCAESRPA